MSKQIAFVARDTDLIRRIEEYQQENKLLYFVEAVRQLCEKRTEIQRSAEMRRMSYENKHSECIGSCDAGCCSALVFPAGDVYARSL